MLEGNERVVVRSEKTGEERGRELWAKDDEDPCRRRTYGCLLPAVMLLRRFRWDSAGACFSWGEVDL